MTGCDHGYAKEMDLDGPEEFMDDSPENGPPEKDADVVEPIAPGEKRETVVTDGEKASLYQ